MTDCVFCKIVNKEVPCNKVHEDDNFMAFLDIRPVNPGHVLVIPKKHYRWIWNVENFGEYFEFAKKVERGMEKALGTDWIVVGVAGNEINHAHVHLIPRFKEDGHGGFVKIDKFKQISKEELAKIAEKISKNI